MGILRFYTHLDLEEMHNRIWTNFIGEAVLIAIRYLVLFVALYPIWLLVGVSASEPALWQKMLWHIVFPLVGLPWPESVAGVVTCLLANSILWGVICQLLIQLRSTHLAQTGRFKRVVKKS